MSKASSPCDNSFMESFFSKLKNEHLSQYMIKTEEELNDYIFGYYNHKIAHSYLG